MSEEFIDYVIQLNDLVLWALYMKQAEIYILVITLTISLQIYLKLHFLYDNMLDKHVFFYFRQLLDLFFMVLGKLLREFLLVALHQPLRHEFINRHGQLDSDVPSDFLQEDVDKFVEKYFVKNDDFIIVLLEV